jgi:hypothetical protein
MEASEQRCHATYTPVSVHRAPLDRPVCAGELKSSELALSEPYRDVSPARGIHPVEPEFRYSRQPGVLEEIQEHLFGLQVGAGLSGTEDTVCRGPVCEVWDLLRPPLQQEVAVTLGAAEGPSAYRGGG